LRFETGRHRWWVRVPAFEHRVDGGAEDAGLLDFRHRVERTHRADGIVCPHFENRARLEDAFELVHRTVRGQSPCLDDRDPLTVFGLVEIMRP
jgi:hypothetical protein